MPRVIPLHVHSEAPGPYFARVCRVDTGQWLDPSDPTGDTWSQSVPVAGWPLGQVPSAFAGAPERGPAYPGDWLGAIPIGPSWPDVLDVLIVIHRGEAAEDAPRVDYQTVRVYRDEAPTWGRLSIPVQLRHA